MRCRKARIMISEYTDGTLAPRKVAGLEEHLGKCADCRAVLADLRVLVHEARGLETPPVPAEAWSGIRARLRERGAAAARRERALFGRPRLAPALAALALTAVAAGGVFVGLKLGRRPVVLSPDMQEQATLAKLDEAERYYELAVKSLGEALAGQGGKLSPEVAEMFARNLEVVDVAIQACRKAVRSEPDNVRARDYLLAAYREKIVLLDDLLDMDRAASPGERRGEAL
jgi:anti-sigma factor RsiW